MNFLIAHCFKKLCGISSSSKQLDKNTQERVNACAAFANKSSPLLMHLHNSISITQINSVPMGSRCAVTGKQLNASNGVQLIMDKAHLCLHNDVMMKWFHYYRIRHFPDYVCGIIRQWVKEQPWFIINKDIDLSRLMSSHWPNTVSRMYKESMHQIKV